MIGGPKTYDVVTCYNPGGGFSITKNYESGTWKTVELIEQNELKIMNGIEVFRIGIPSKSTVATVPLHRNGNEFYFEFDARYTGVSFNVALTGSISKGFSVGGGSSPSTVTLGPETRTINCHFRAANGQEILLASEPRSYYGKATGFGYLTVVASETHQFSRNANVNVGPTTGVKRIKFTGNVDVVGFPASVDLILF